MKLTLYRYASQDGATLGQLFMDGLFECYTLEDVVRDHKIPGVTAIPFGTYQIDVTYSPRFQRYLPLLADVPGYIGVRIHPGNRAEDTEGCILVGTQTAGTNMISNSREAFNALYKKIRSAIEAGEPVFIEIVQGVRT